MFSHAAEGCWVWLDYFIIKRLETVSDKQKLSLWTHHVQVSFKSHQLCFSHFTSLSWALMFRHESCFLWGSWAEITCPFPEGHTPSIWVRKSMYSGIPNQIIHNGVCVNSSWKQWLDHNQHFLVWYTPLRSSAFFSLKVEEILQFHQHFLFLRLSLSFTWND